MSAANLTAAEATAAGLQTALVELHAAAKTEAIEVDGPLGAWVRAQDAIIQRMIDFSDRLDRLAREVLTDFREAAEAELSRQRIVTEQSKVALYAARDARDSVETTKTKVASEMIKDMAPKIVAGVSEAVVIRERRYNRSIEIRRAAYVGGTMLGLFLGGFTLRFVQDWTAVMQLSQSQAGLQHCKDTSPYVDKDGMRLCRMSDFIPRG